MVSPIDTILPGSDVVYLPDMVHFEPAMQIIGTRYKNGPMTQALLGCLIDKVRREQHES